MYLSSTTIDTKGYVLGGYDGTSEVADNDEYGSDTWVSKTDMPAPARMNSAAIAINSKGYIIGGYGGGIYLEDTDEYVVDTWVSKSPMVNPSQRYSFDGVTI